MAKQKKKTPGKAAPKAKESVKAKAKASPAKGLAKPVAKTPAKVVVKPAGKTVTKPASKVAGKSAPKPPAKTVSKSSAGKKGEPEQVIKPSNGKHPFLTKAELEMYRKSLLNFRDRLVDEIGFLSGDNIARNSHETSGDLSSNSMQHADQGTDNFDREFALNLASGEHDVLFETDEALRRIDLGTYGICEITQKPIDKARLKVIPYARYCLSAQSEIERGKTKWRPFGPTLSQL